MDAIYSVIHTMQALIKVRPFLSTATALVLGTALLAYRDYRSYVALGPHGLPANFWGWRQQLRMGFIARKDTTVPAPYHLDKFADTYDRTSFLPQSHNTGLSWRTGNKAPHVPGFTAPQRQTTDVASAATKKAMHAHMDALVAANPGVLLSTLSKFEGPVPAVAVKPVHENNESHGGGGGGKAIQATRGEMCHIHPPDGSTHLLLALADQRTVIELGWGARHRLSGTRILPWNYTFVYAPRNDEELEVWKKIVNAAAKFCCAGVADIQVPN